MFPVGYISEAARSQPSAVDQGKRAQSDQSGDALQRRAFIAAEAAPTRWLVALLQSGKAPGIPGLRPHYARKRLGATPLQRWKAWRKLAVSLKPSASAMRYTGHCSSLSSALARSKRSSSSWPW